MEKSDYTTPRVFSLMRMMSHPKSLIEQFIHLSSEILLDDGVEILNCQLSSSNTIPEIFCDDGWCTIQG